MAGEDHVLGSPGWRLILWVAHCMALAGVAIALIDLTPGYVSTTIFVGGVVGALAWATAEGHIDWTR